MSPRTKLPFSLLLLGAALVVSGVPVSGFQGEKTDLDQAAKHELNEQRATIRERNRSSLHPGDPLVLVGVEQRDNDLRSRSPALKNGMVVPRQVDLEELREQKLDLYREEVRSPQVVSIPHRAVEEVVRPARAPEAPSSKDALLDPRAALVLVSLLSTALVGLLCFRRYRRMSERMEDDLHVPGVPLARPPAATGAPGVVRAPRER